MSRAIEFPALTPEQLGRLLRGYRKEAKLSQQQVASLGGLLQKTVSRLERDPGSASIETLFRIFTALNIEVMLRKRGARSSEADW